MYHAIVRRVIRSLFDAVNRGDSQPVLDAFAQQFEHVFLGGSALGGRRTSIESTKAWYGRLYRLMPDIHFDIDSIAVSGTPWNTQAVVRWCERNSGTDGVVTTNAGIHAVHIRWGKMTSLVICPDTVLVIATLDRLAAIGVSEAHAAMIEG